MNIVQAMQKGLKKICSPTWNSWAYLELPENPFSVKCNLKSQGSADGRSMTVLLFQVAADDFEEYKES